MVIVSPAEQDRLTPQPRSHVVVHGSGAPMHDRTFCRDHGPGLVGSISGVSTEYESTDDPADHTLTRDVGIVVYDQDSSMDSYRDQTDADELNALFESSKERISVWQDELSVAVESKVEIAVRRWSHQTYDAQQKRAAQAMSVTRTDSLKNMLMADEHDDAPLPPISWRTRLSFGVGTTAVMAVVNDLWNSAGL